MKRFIETTCPMCAVALVLVEDTLPPLKTPLLDDLIEAECSECGWEFACNQDGAITDDGGADRESPFTIDEEGELDAEELRQVRCPRCQEAHEVGEEGLTGCPHCRQVFVVTEPRLEREPEEWEEEEWDVLPWDATGEYADDLHCPHCGCDSGHEDCDGGGFPFVADGRAECCECGHRFLPGLEGGLEPLEPQADHVILEALGG